MFVFYAREAKAWKIVWVCAALTLDPVMDIFVEMWHVLSEVEEESHRSQDHAQVGVAKTIIQHIL